jgi:hypothetical protein
VRAISDCLCRLETTPFRGVGQGIFGDNPVDPIRVPFHWRKLVGKEGADDLMRRWTLVRTTGEHRCNRTAHLHGSRDNGAIAAI